jgi:serralysin
MKGVITMSNNLNRWCFAWFPSKPLGAGTTKAALQKDSKWKSGDTIRIAFMEGDDKLQRRVRDVAMRWVAPGMANLQLSFTDSSNSQVRVAFRAGNGSWSTVGTTCKQVAADKPTMNFGWINSDSADDEVRRVVLHEFGHAIGLIHEHQNPVAAIKWNRDAVIRELSGPPNNWSVEEIGFNVLNPASPDDVNATTLDPTSIMMYPIPASWTENGFSTDLNGDLSKVDRQFIRTQYT